MMPPTAMAEKLTNDNTDYRLMLHLRQKMNVGAHVVLLLLKGKQLSPLWNPHTAICSAGKTTEFNQLCCCAMFRSSLMNGTRLESYVQHLPDR